MRQQVYALHAHRPGFKVVPRSTSYVEDMSSALYCLAPTGGGHGKRQVLVARFGCIPVPITDYVMQPFEPELPWAEFSVPVAEADVPRLHTILADIPPQRLQAMQAALQCASRHLWWSSMWGGIFGEDGRYDAFATLMELLAARRRHPGAEPQDLMALDPEWAKFARCELGDDTELAAAALALGQQGNEAPVTSGAGGLCTYGFDDNLRKFAPTPFCDASKSGQYGIPGGAVCDGAPNIAQCPRPWQ
ncbi:uncharacterized protein HaLaN_07679 [Haematococcus lacustris]|uniref:Exostosin GT47 domain-containing protein n=1 Tax=Haematococcus lacustris TaxID=44745 RepID=A0A699YPJ9_HAELA|nr:uncharacterized protein HaLaN_07679 [Haematococcus lacustris]